MIDVQVWAGMLAIQAIPYLAAVLVSLISGIPKLPARLVGVMPPMQGLKEGSSSPVPEQK